MADDSDDLEQAIRERAYELWRQAGGPDGRHEEFWHQARKELTARGSDMKTDEAMKESFPASDPPANSGIVGPEAKSEHAIKAMDQ